MILRFQLKIPTFVIFRTKTTVWLTNRQIKKLRTCFVSFLWQLFVRLIFCHSFSWQKILSHPEKNIRTIFFHFISHFLTPQIHPLSKIFFSNCFKGSQKYWATRLKVLLVLDLRYRWEKTINDATVIKGSKYTRLGKNKKRLNLQTNRSTEFSIPWFRICWIKI